MHAIFDHPATDLQRVATYPAVSVPIEASAATPVIITSCKRLETLRNDSTVMQSELQSFLSAFEGSPLQLSAGRGQMKTNDQALKKSLQDGGIRKTEQISNRAR